jgi:hypothetical protein
MQFPLDCCHNGGDAAAPQPGSRRGARAIEGVGKFYKLARSNKPPECAGRGGICHR